MSDTDEQTVADEPTPADDLTVAPNGPPARQSAVPCPHCETPIALVVSYGPMTHEATPCGCQVSGHILEKTRTDAE